MSIESRFDISFTASLALQEKQIQQNYRPYIAVHKWFARRPGTLFRALLLSEFVDAPLEEIFFQGNALEGISIADPFMGGGTPLLEANRVGCNVLGYDINPMSHWIVSREIEDLDIEGYCRAARNLTGRLESEIGHMYRTTCVKCGNDNASVKYFLWVKTITCSHCTTDIDLFPGFLVAKDVRHTANVFVCPACRALNEVTDRKHPGACANCGYAIEEGATAKRNRIVCQECGTVNTYPRKDDGAPQHRLFAIEYHCPACRGRHKGRYFKAAGTEDFARFREAESRLAHLSAEWIPDDDIPPGDETDRLHRWGYIKYREMFNARQLVGLELSVQYLMEEKDERIRRALATNLSDLLRYQNMLCRYDSMALKSLDIFSVHGFPVGLVQCESNLLGIPTGDGRNIGSGGWSNIVEKYKRAKQYCQSPFEVQRVGSKKKEIRIETEKITDRANGSSRRTCELRCDSAAKVALQPQSLDGVFTDPPYFGNVQYAELMDFCYVWLRRMFGKTEAAFRNPSTRNDEEFTVNRTRGRGIEHFTAGMTATFSAMAKGLKSGAPLVFTYHHNQLQAYFPIALALLDSGLTCSAVFPCPAEMGGSIHINGTGSSVVDSVFVCRRSGATKKAWIVDSSEGIAALVERDMECLRQGGLKATAGDTRCVAFGHVIRLGVWHLRKDWDATKPIAEKIAALERCVGKWGGIEQILADCDAQSQTSTNRQGWLVSEEAMRYGETEPHISF